MPNQEAFNRVWNRYGVDRKPWGWDPRHQTCTVGGGPDNLPPCAVGFLAGKAYQGGMLNPRAAWQALKDKGVNGGLLISIQTAHDSGAKYDGRAGFRKLMRQTAALYGLVCPPGRERAK